MISLEYVSIFSGLKFTIHLCFFSVHILLSGIFTLCRFPSLVKASKPGKSDATPAKGSLTSEKLNVMQIDPPSPQTEVDHVKDGLFFSLLVEISNCFELYLRQIYFRFFQLSYTMPCGCWGKVLLQKLERVSCLTTYLGKLFDIFLLVIQVTISPCRIHVLFVVSDYKQCNWKIKFAW